MMVIRVEIQYLCGISPTSDGLAKAGKRRGYDMFLFAKLVLTHLSRSPRAT
jgi:hypothetical protein